MFNAFFDWFEFSKLNKTDVIAIYMELNPTGTLGFVAETTNNIPKEKVMNSHDYNLSLTNQ